VVKPVETFTTWLLGFDSASMMLLEKDLMNIYITGRKECSIPHWSQSARMVHPSNISHRHTLIADLLTERCVGHIDRWREPTSSR
jgi:hypothetical protein